jgi:choline kinase
MNTKDALILAAGLGSRLSAEEGHKLMARVGGVAMLGHHLEGLERLGVTTLTVVTGHANEELEAQLDAWSSPIKIQYVYNPEYRKSNGLSVLAGANKIGGPFWLLMSDHLFEPALFDRLRQDAPRIEASQGMLAIDLKLDTIYDMPDATKLQLEDHLVAIGKDIEPFNVVDAGLFWCGPGFVRALEQELELRGDCSTSDAVRRLDASREFLFWDVGPHLWQDVDTPGARAHAEGLLAAWRNA